MTLPADPLDPAASTGRHLVRRATLPAHIARTAGGLFASVGYAAVSMEQVAARAGVSKRTLYKYFPAKEALLAHQLESELAQDIDGLGHRLDANAPFRANMSALLAESAAWCERHPDHLLPYIRYKFATFEPVAEPAEERGLVRAWTMLIEAGQRRGDLATARPAGQLAVYFHYLYLGALMRWLTDPGLGLAREFATVLDLFVDGARA